MIATCLLKTAVAPIIAGRTQVNIHFDEGAQHSFISLAMLNELQITSDEQTTDKAVASFSTTTSTQQKFGTAAVEVETISGELIPLHVLIAPSISVPNHISISSTIHSMPHLQEHKQ